MRQALLLACTALLATTIGTASAAERCVPVSSNSVWIEGSWQQCNGQYTWKPGYWQTSTTTVCATPPQNWVEGHWAQGANGMVWVEGHYEQAPTVCATTPQVVYAPPQQQVVYVPPPRPAVQTTVVIGGGNCGYSGYYNSGYHNSGYYNSGYNQCPTPVYRRPACQQTVVVKPPSRPVQSVNVSLPKPSIGFPTVNGHKIPLPIPVSLSEVRCGDVTERPHAQPISRTLCCGALSKTKACR
jgi:hypothetical protein